MKFDGAFPLGRAFLPVIHVRDLNQALRNAKLALECGADGFFLISHQTDRVDAAGLFGIYGNIRQLMPDAWIGINCLDLSPDEMFEHAPEDLNGIWVDNCGYPGNSQRFQWYKDAQSRSRFSGLYFPSVAFKYQPRVEQKDLPVVANIVAGVADVVTTSGEGTGKPAEREKIRTILEAIGDVPLAIASGITAENVTEYLSLGVRCFLVASGISGGDWDNLDPRLTRELAAKIHAFE